MIFISIYLLIDNYNIRVINICKSRGYWCRAQTLFKGRWHFWKKNLNGVNIAHFFLFSHRNQTKIFRFQGNLMPGVLRHQLLHSPLVRIDLEPYNLLKKRALRASSRCVLNVSSLHLSSIIRRSSNILNRPANNICRHNFRGVSNHTSLSQLWYVINFTIWTAIASSVRS